MDNKPTHKQIRAGIFIILVIIAIIINDKQYVFDYSILLLLIGGAGMSLFTSILIWNDVAFDYSFLIFKASLFIMIMNYLIRLI